MSLFSTLTELMEDKLGTQSRQAQPEDEAMAVKALANDLDVDKLGEQFRKFAGHDDCLSKDARIPPHAAHKPAPRRGPCPRPL